MKEMLLNKEGCKIECDIKGLKMTYTYADDPKFHFVVTLKDYNLYKELKRELNEIYESADDLHDACRAVNDHLQSVDCHDRYFTGDYYCYHDLRTRKEIEKYESEAYDKVWLMRNWRPSAHGPNRDVERILNIYDDISEDGYDEWDCGYWNGIMGALRWVLGDERDFLDT